MSSPNDPNGKLDWMYKGPNSTVNREEYLLGRSVDKTLEQLNAEEKTASTGALAPPKNHVEHECIPPSIRDYNKIVQAEQVDLSAKLQEDPLMAIKKREEEARRAFLQNPVQLKKLQKALEAQKKMKNKKSKKKKKKKRSSSSDSDLDEKISKKLKKFKNSSLSSSLLKKKEKKREDDTLDTILMHKFNQLKDKLSQDDLNDIINGDVSGSSEDEREKMRKKDKKRRNYSSSSSSETEEYRKGKQRRNKTPERQRQEKKYPTRREYESDEDGKPPSKHSWGLIRSDGTKIPLNHKSSEKHNSQKSESGTKKTENKPYEKPKSSKRLTEEEKEQRRKEMMKNAEWRDRERVENVKRYRENDKKEEKESTSNYDPDFIHKELIKSANNSSVESRIKSNLNNIQRNSKHMNTNFSRRH